MNIIPSCISLITLLVDIAISASSCYGYQDAGVMIAAANEALFQGGAACGKYFQVTCTGDLCPSPGCKGDLDVSHESFSAIADPAAGGIKISYQEWAVA